MRARKGTKLYLSSDTIECLNCEKICLKYPNKSYLEPRKYCCRNCSVEHHKKIRPIGKEHYLWGGEGVHYSTKHSWLRRNIGKADHCEHCKKEGLFYQWANKSGKYKRNIEDWIQLCRSCHVIYDHIKINGNKCRRGHSRDKYYKIGEWCKYCRLENYQINKIKIRKQVRDRYWKYNGVANET